jgi:hypothetical protein
VDVWRMSRKSFPTFWNIVISWLGWDFALRLPSNPFRSIETAGLRLDVFEKSHWNFRAEWTEWTHNNFQNAYKYFYALRNDRFTELSKSRFWRGIYTE